MNRDIPETCLIGPVARMIVLGESIYIVTQESFSWIIFKCLAILISYVYPDWKRSGLRF
jgi:hypothetical protein